MTNSKLSVEAHNFTRSGVDREGISCAHVRAPSDEITRGGLRKRLNQRPARNVRAATVHSLVPAKIKIEGGRISLVALKPIRTRPIGIVPLAMGRYVSSAPETIVNFFPVECTRLQCPVTVHHPEHVPAVHAVVADETVKIEPALLLDGITANEAALAWIIVSLARYCPAPTRDLRFSSPVPAPGRERGRGRERMGARAGMGG